MLLSFECALLKSKTWHIDRFVNWKLRVFQAFEKWCSILSFRCLGVSHHRLYRDLQLDATIAHFDHLQVHLVKTLWLHIRGLSWLHIQISKLVICVYPATIYDTGSFVVGVHFRSLAETLCKHHHMHVHTVWFRKNESSSKECFFWNAKTILYMQTQSTLKHGHTKYGDLTLNIITRIH